MNMLMDFGTHTYEWGAILGASLVAAAMDMRSGRIPNWLTLPVAAGGMIYAAFSGGSAELGQAIAAWALLMLPYFLLFVLGRGGAGDAKMMGAIGAWLGLREGIIALCCVCIVGGLVAVLRVLCHDERRVILRNVTTSLYVSAAVLAGGRKTWNLLTADRQEQVGGQSEEVTIPYGIAIFLGVCLTAFMVHL
ncbi:MAG: prepilin peptidase [Planctomycetaceae bacterium]|nr:MAG: prepilin peptidase [Planctomycetaceae bacterium]